MLKHSMIFGVSPPDWAIAQLRWFIIVVISALVCLSLGGDARIPDEILESRPMQINQIV